ncbi:MAG: YrbL family protein [Akkermansiaceae bacterium]
MIKLSDAKPFAHGNHRKVFLHPERANRCLKVMTEDWRECDRRKKASWLARLFRPRRHFHENEGELDFSTKLGRRAGSAAWEFVARAHGIVESDLGPALEVDLIIDHDDKVSLTLKEHVWRHGLTPECKKALERFWQGLDENWIFVQARPDNVSVKVKADGSCQIYAIDGYAFGQLIPLAKWFGREKKRILLKRREKHERALKSILARRKSGDELQGQGIQKQV